MKKILYEDSPNLLKSHTIVIFIFIGISFISYGIPILMYLIIILLQNLSFKFQISSDKILFKRGILFRKKSFIKVKDIKDYEINQDIFQEKFGYCDIIFYTAVGTNREIRINGIKNKIFIEDLMDRLVK